MTTLAVTRRHDLTDEQWAVLAPLLPIGRRPGRPSAWTKRQLIDGIRWRIRAGAPWRDLPECYGSWAAAYALFRRWQRDGTRAQILTALQAQADAAGRITWDVSVDSTTARAHQHAASRASGVPRLDGGRPRVRPDRVLVDKAYTSKANRRYLRRRGIKATIPSKPDQDANRRKLGSKGGRPPAFDPKLYNSVMPWSAASTGSNVTAPSPPGSTS